MENFSIQHINNFSICCIKKTFSYGQVVYVCYIGKYMSDDREQVNNKSIDMTYLRKRYMNIAPTGYNISFTERQNLPYSVLL